MRTYDEPLRYNLLMIDDHVAVVQPYLYRARGLDTPTFYIERSGDEDRGIYRAFAQVYEWLWQRGRAHADS